MSKEYNDYLKEHVKNVENALDWMQEHNIITDSTKETILNRKHDESKWSDEEYDAYDDYFYGKEGRDEDDLYEIDKAFSYAWLHHIHNNPHHWQYWVLIDDDGSTQELEMERSYAFEMIADWWSFSWKKGDLTVIFDWYEKHKDGMRMHPDTRALVEKILSAMKDILSNHAS